jgi:hypothetical protein
MSSAEAPVAVALDVGTKFHTGMLLVVDAVS